MVDFKEEYDNSVIKEKTENKVFSKEDIVNYKNSFNNKNELNKVVYFNIMKLKNEYLWSGGVGRMNDIDKITKWTSILFNTNNEKIAEINECAECMENFETYGYFLHKLMVDYELDSFFDYMVLMDMVCKDRFKCDSMIIVNDYNFNNKELMEKFGVNHIGEDYESICKILCNTEFGDCIIKWGEIKNRFNNDKALYKILQNKSNKKNKEWWCCNLGKLNDFVSGRY